jgi:hypothetical protein
MSPAMEISYDFEGIAIQLGGIFIDSFSGSATLAVDDHETMQFYVLDITLDGEKRTTHKPHSKLFPKREKTSICLQYGKVQGREKVIFDLISDALYASAHVQRVWDDAVAMEAA